MVMVRRSRRRGFTLVEVAVAVTVAGIALTATAGALVQGARLAKLASETRCAMRCSQSVMERVRATPYAQISTTFNNQTFSMNAMGAGESSGQCAVAVTPVTTGSARWTVLQVTVTATWKGVSGNSSQAMTTLVCDRTNGAVQ
jgi:prepilin-type N-terminal cleavage/methylation domain-containing protein